MSLWWKTYRVAVGIVILLLVIGLIFLLSRKSQPDPFVQLQEQMDKHQHVIDSLTTVGNQLKTTEKQIEIKWRNRNEKQIIYILTSADTVQPAIRTKQRARADSLLAHYQ